MVIVTYVMVLVIKLTNVDLEQLQWIQDKGISSVTIATSLDILLIDAGMWML